LPVLAGWSARTRTLLPLPVNEDESQVCGQNIMDQAVVPVRGARCMNGSVQSEHQGTQPPQSEPQLTCTYTQYELALAVRLGCEKTAACCCSHCPPATAPGGVPERCPACRGGSATAPPALARPPGTAAPASTCCAAAATCHAQSLAPTKQQHRACELCELRTSPHRKAYAAHSISVEACQCLIR
jgi:hypothetical protein